MIRHEAVEADAVGGASRRCQSLERLELGSASDHVQRDVGSARAEECDRFDEGVDALARRQVAEVDDAAPLDAVLGDGRHAVEPGAHRDDERRRLLAETQPGRARVASRGRQLDARVGASAREPVDRVVEARERRPLAEAVLGEVDRPEHDLPGASEPPLGEPARAGERVEPEPDRGPRHANGDEGVERVRGDGPERCPVRARPHGPAVLVLGHEVPPPVLGQERVRDRDDVRSPADEEVAERLRRAVSRAVGGDHERRAHRSLWPAAAGRVAYRNASPPPSRSRR